MKTTTRPALSRRAKFWIGLSLSLLLPCAAALCLWLVYRACFPNNPRLVVNSVRLAGNSGYWRPAEPDEREKRIERICSILGIAKGRTPLFSGDSDRMPGAMAAKLRREIPELERANVRRVMPDQLIFELHERIPAANLGKGFYIDEEGVVLDQSSYSDLSGTLPTLSLKRELKRGELLTDSSIQTVLEFIRQTRQEFIRIRVKHFYISQDFIQCDLFFGNDPGLFSIQIPVRVSVEQMRNDIFGRLIPTLEATVRNRGEDRYLDLRFRDRIIAKKRN